jgi:hypothetical protein
MIAPGTHIGAVGADEPGKAELSSELLSDAKFVCDDPELAVEMGALAGVGLGREAIHSSLGEVPSGSRPGRSDDMEITLFGSVGLPCQDLPGPVDGVSESQDARQTDVRLPRIEAGGGDAGPAQQPSPARLLALGDLFGHSQGQEGAPKPYTRRPTSPDALRTF